MKLTTIFALLNFNYDSISGVSESIVIVVLPDSSSDVQTSLGSCEKILPGVEATINRINNDSNVLKDTNLELVTAIGSSVLSENEPYSGNVLEVVANLTRRNKNVIGIAGLIHSSILPVLQAFQLPIASLIGTSKSTENNVLSLTASTSVLTDSVLSFLAAINQTNVGVISESTHSYYSTISNDLITKANVSLYFYVSGGHHILSSIIGRIANSNVHVIFLTVRPSIAVSVLLKACKCDMKWPNYVWIVHSYRLEDLHKLASSCQLCDRLSILDGIFTFQLVQDLEFDVNSMQKPNLFGVLLQDAIWALAFAASNKSSTDKYRHLSEVYIYQASNLSAELIGVYSGTSNSLTNFSKLGAFAYDGPVIIRLHLNPAVLVTSIVCLLFNTLLLHLLSKSSRCEIHKC